MDRPDVVPVRGGRMPLRRGNLDDDNPPRDRCLTAGIGRGRLAQPYLNRRRWRVGGRPGVPGRPAVAPAWVLAMWAALMLLCAMPARAAPPPAAASLAGSLPYRPQAQVRGTISIWGH